MKAAFVPLVLSLSLLSIGLSCKSAQPAASAPSVSATPPAASADAGLKSLAPFPIGAAVSVSLLKNNPTYQQLVVREFNSITPENAMKFRVLHPAENTWDWSEADYLMQFAQQHGMRMHGHTLIWYKSLPQWVKDYQGSREDWENLFKTHIQTVVKHFKGKVVSWDVVNEDIADQGGITRADNLWRQKLGDDYIARAFQYAHEADPDVLLFYNDYGNEWGPLKRTAILNIVKDLQKRKLPINGIGLQMHVKSSESESNVVEAITTAAATGLKVHIAELDVRMNPTKAATTTFTPELAEQQKQRYKLIAKTYSALPKAQRFGMTTWNVTDADSWIPGEFKCPDWPMPFDAQYQRKPAYDGFAEGLK